MADPEHDWEQTGWEYDDSFFRCRRCKLETHQSRGYPAKTVKECQEAGLAPCKENNPLGVAKSTTPENHICAMVDPDFKLETIHPNEEPFWVIGSPYDEPGTPFLLDRAGMRELIKQCQEALKVYEAKYP